MATDNDKNNIENKETKPKEKENEWGVFAMKVLTAFCSILIIGLLGANFVYYTRINLDLFFPTDVNQRPYTDENKVGNKLPPLFPKRNDIEAFKQAGGKRMFGGSNGSGCGAPIDFTQSPLINNKYFSGIFEYGFPYSMESKKDTFGGILTNWFSNKVKYSYVWQRMFIKSVINFVGSTCDFVPESMKDIVPFILGPIAIGFIMIVTSFWWIPTLISVFWNETQNWGLVISILGLFFGWTWSIPIFLTFIKVIGVLFSFILLPVMLNGRKIMEIMGNNFNSYYLLLLFFIMTIVAAFTNLTLPVAIPMLIIFLIAFIPPGMNPMAKAE